MWSRAIKHVNSCNPGAFISICIYEQRDLLLSPARFMWLWVSLTLCKSETNICPYIKFTTVKPQYVKFLITPH
jgi:hypothetical protein